MQIYADFSGYTDIAIGLAMFLGFRFPDNFDAPYTARNLQDFWRRWHMTLSRWLRDYLYIPLGGARGSRWSVARNIMITMVLGGLWHGAAWTFVAWGAIHGVGPGRGPSAPVATGASAGARPPCPTAAVRVRGPAWSPSTSCAWAGSSSAPTRSRPPPPCIGRLFTAWGRAPL